MWRVQMRMTASELAFLLKASSNDTKELSDLRERVLKLEQTTKELLDLLTDFRVKQIMDSDKQN